MHLGADVKSRKLLSPVKSPAVKGRMNMGDEKVKRSRRRSGSAARHLGV